MMNADNTNYDTEQTAFQNNIPNDAEFGSWVSDKFGENATVIPLTEIHVDISRRSFNEMKADKKVMLQFTANYIASTLAERSNQRESVRKHLKAILEILNEGNQRSRESARRKSITLSEFHNRCPPARFIHDYTKVILYATHCDRPKMLEAIDNATDSFDAMLVWGENHAETDGEYLNMANHLKLIFQSNGRLLEDMDALNMFERKNTKRLNPRTYAGETGVFIPSTGIELLFPLTMMRVYDRMFLDDDEDLSKYETHSVEDKRVIVPMGTDDTGGWIKVADWADDVITKSGGLEDPFTIEEMERCVV